VRRSLRQSGGRIVAKKTKAKRASKVARKPRESQTDAAPLLKSQHREVEALFAQLEKVPEKNAAKKGAIVAEIIAKLEGHAKIEEEIFYPEIKDIDEDLTLEAYEEHGVVHDLIAKLRATEPSDETYMAKATVLKEVIEHHVEEEEDELFPKVRKTLEAERLEELAEEMKPVFEATVGEAEAQAGGKRGAPLKAAAARRRA